MPEIGVYQGSIGKQGSREQLHTPALLLDLEALNRNAERMNSYLEGTSVKLRPHSKAHKCGVLGRLQMDWGAVGISCANLTEAEAMAEAGIPSILVTSPVVTATMLERLMAVASRIDELVVVVDHPQNVLDLSSAAKTRGVGIGALVDIDVGQHRTGVLGPKEAVELASALRDSGIDYRGVQAYYGHLQHVSTYTERVERVNEQVGRLEDVIEALEANDLKPQVISGGGTGTFHIDLENRVFTELQVGSYLFMDRQYAGIELTPDNPRPFEHALFVQANVVSKNQPGLAVVNAGWKAFSTEDRTPQVHDGAPLDAEYRWMGDEHGGLQISDAAKPDLGSRVEFIPNHCDPTVNLYRSFHCIRGNTLVDLWTIDGNGY